MRDVIVNIKIKRYTEIMEIGIYGTSDTAFLLGGLLKLKENNVSFLTGQEKNTPPERFVLPDRWLKIKKMSFTELISPEILFLCEDMLPSKLPENVKTSLNSETEVIIFNKKTHNLKRESVTFALSLFETGRLQEDTLELYSLKSFLIMEKNKKIKKLISQLKQYKIQAKFVDDITPYYNAAFLYKLVWLPVSLADATLPYFLSYPEGRTIIQSVLREGFKIFESLDKKISNLPVMDPGKLLTSIQKNPEKYNIERYRPNRSFPTIHQGIIKEIPRDNIYIPNKELEKMGIDSGIETFWNSKILYLAKKITKNNLFRNPGELLKAIK